MDPAELQDVFPDGELCRITLVSSERLETNPRYMRYTKGALVIRGTWSLVTEEDEDVPVIGARVIPWSEVQDIDSSNRVRNWSRDDLKRLIEWYGISDSDAHMFLSWAK